MARPTARDIFPTLQRYKAFWPRRADRLPIGFQHNWYPIIFGWDERKRFVSDQMAALYHDLGVLVFAGCTARQTQRIGNILKVIVARGGLAHMRVLIRKTNSVQGRIPADYDVQLMDRPLNHNPYGVPIEGQITASGIAELGDECSVDSLPVADFVQAEALEMVQNKMKIELTAPLPRRSVLLETATGTRRLPLAYHVSWSSWPGEDQVQSEVWISTRGTEDIVGHVIAIYQTRVRESFTLHNVARLAQQGHIPAAIYQYNTELKMEVQNRSFDPLRSESPFWTAKWILEELCALEKEIWADRYDEAVRNWERGRGEADRLPRQGDVPDWSTDNPSDAWL
ncbi:hypothetical protein NLU13_1531 [Sarocladium strictum]|uniref:Uncharacterized protein n=1 Tax=Sarocladium strictum TaxID=5046 RepID=A0AA39GR51_SARSR|nr:hypothetical protein NLU13_1531 [Sarocladium strictum]